MRLPYKIFFEQIWNSFTKGGYNMKAKKIVAIGMTVLMIGGLFAGCGNSGNGATEGKSNDKVTITIFQSKIEANEGYCS